MAVGARQRASGRHGRRTLGPTPILDVIRTSIVENDDGVHSGGCRSTIRESRVAHNGSDGVTGSGAPMLIERSTIVRNGDAGISYGASDFEKRDAELTIVDSTINGNGASPHAFARGRLHIDGARPYESSARRSPTTSATTASLRVPSGRLERR
jgi:hypothetical protein